MSGYNNYFPTTYTYPSYAYGGQSTSVPYAQTQTSAPTPNAINWVQGEAGARSVPVQPGQKALLMDSETNVFYVKSCDTSGMPLPLRIFEYKEVSKVAHESTDDGAPSAYVTHEELEERLKQLTSPKEDKPNEFII